MKKIILAMLAVTLVTFANAQKTDEAQPEQKDITKYVQFGELDHDFGKIPFGKPAEFELTMKNISPDSLKIQEVKVGCGCTTPKWNAGPYAAGSDFKITIGFNGATDGEFHKVVTVYFEGGLSQVIKFHGSTYKTPDNPAPGNGAIEKMKSGGQ